MCVYVCIYTPKLTYTEQLQLKVKKGYFGSA